MNNKFLKKSILFVYIFTLISMIPFPTAHSMHNGGKENNNAGEIIECMACADEVGECYHLELKIHSPNNSGEVKNQTNSYTEEKINFVLNKNLNSFKNSKNKICENLKLLDSIILRC